jgi:arsenite-transporting ATPase
MRTQFAAEGHYTLVVSTDPAHSLSDSLAQSVSGGAPVAVDGTDGRLWGLELDPDLAKEELKAFTTGDGGKGIADFASQMGLGPILAQLSDLKLSELLDTPPPGLDEAIAITKVISFTKDEQFAKFTRIVFDTAPTGHTLRLLTLPDFLDATVTKIVRLRQKIYGAATAVKSLFGVGDGSQDEAVQKLEALKARLQEVRDLFRDEKTTEFVIVTIPTVLAISESQRLLVSLRAERVPVRRLVVNQLMRQPSPGSNAAGLTVAQLRGQVDAAADAMRAAVAAAPGGAEQLAAAGEQLAEKAKQLSDAISADATFVAMKRKDQQRAMQLVESDAAGLASLRRVEANLVDVEIRGVPALQFFASQVWT